MDVSSALLWCRQSLHKQVWLEIIWYEKLIATRQHLAGYCNSELWIYVIDVISSSGRLFNRRDSKVLWLPHLRLSALIWLFSPSSGRAEPRQPRRAVSGRHQLQLRGAWEALHVHGEPVGRREVHRRLGAAVCHPQVWWVVLVELN